MKKVTLEIDEKYATVLAVTVVGCNGLSTDVSTHAVDITKHNHITLDEDGRWTNAKENDDGKL